MLLITETSAYEVLKKENAFSVEKLALFDGAYSKVSPGDIFFGDKIEITDRLILWKEGKKVIRTSPIFVMS